MPSIRRNGITIGGLFYWKTYRITINCGTGNMDVFTLFVTSSDGLENLYGIKSIGGEISNRI
jgi:hypothetical protein